MAMALILLPFTGCGSKTAKPQVVAREQTFDPGLVLSWPNKPEESSQVFDSSENLTKHYSASCALKLPDGILLFSAFVEEYADDKFGGHSPEQMLYFHNFGFMKNETSRKSIEHGTKKYPGLVIESRGEKVTTKRIEVVAVRRIYSISVSSRNEKLLARPEAATFLESLKIEN